MPGGLLAKKLYVMKKLYYSTLFLLAGLGLAAQDDILLSENFQSDPTAGWATYPSGDDQVWMILDEDGQPANGNDPVEQNWYWGELYFTHDTSETQYGLHSLSWMADPSVQNMNWLVTPPLEIVDDQAVLHWSSAPYQLPRYMDGYKVLVSTSTNEPVSFTDTVFIAAEMTAILGAGGATIDLDSFEFSDGYFHGNMLTDTAYFEVSADSTICDGYMEPHSVSLADYAGQTIYIAFLHDSFDDNILSLDDIMVTGNLEASATNARTAENYRFVTYPNPAVRQLNVLYRLPEAAEVSLQIVDMQGRTVQAVLSGSDQAAGEYQYPVRVGDLHPGNYLTVLTVNGNQVVKPFVKQ